MAKYRLEFILDARDVTAELIREYLLDLGDKVEVSHLSDPAGDAGVGGHFKINVHTEDPTVIFDTCAELGRIQSVKVDEQT